MNSPQNTVLFIGRVWPDPKRTAAGWRMVQLIRYFQIHQHKIYFATPGPYPAGQPQVTPSDYDYLLAPVTTVAIALNDDGFDGQISHINPDYVVFDRFMTEEQYGWRVRQSCPAAMTILDTEDCHFLRITRAKYIKDHPNAFDASACSDEALYAQESMRELASIWRCDLSLIISQFEYTLLKESFAVPEGLLHYLPLAMEDLAGHKNRPKFSQKVPWSHRADFLWVGNRMHDPNDDSLKYLLQELWPSLQRQIPDAALHIVGPNGTEAQRQLILKSTSVVDLGWVDDLPKLMLNYRVNLAPVRFGAGLKGKILQSIGLGLPTVSSAIGAEGLMFENFSALTPARLAEEFIAKAFKLYSDQQHWVEAKEQGARCINQYFSLSQVFSNLNHDLWAIKKDLKAHRNRHFMGQILQHQSINASKYMGRWLTLKNQRFNPE